jgi:nitrous oxidase accessory protein NosD
MYRKVAAVWVSLAMVFGFIVIVDSTMDIIPTVNGTTLYVNTTGNGGAYTSIQDAINDSKNGDTIFVYSGTYFEHIVINISINLMGEDRTTTIIDGGGNGEVVTLNADNTNISKFTINLGVTQFT